MLLDSLLRRYTLKTLSSVTAKSHSDKWSPRINEAFLLLQIYGFLRQGAKWMIVIQATQYKAIKYIYSMAKVKKSKAKKARTDKYDEKLAIDGNFADVFKVVKKNKEEKKNSVKND